MDDKEPRFQFGSGRTYVHDGVEYDSVKEMVIARARKDAPIYHVDPDSFWSVRIQLAFYTMVLLVQRLFRWVK